MSDTLTGAVPVAPTIFREDETLDLDGQRRVVDYVVDAGCAGVCILANYSEQFSLSDEERSSVTDATLSRAAGRIPVVVTTSHYSARVAADRSKDAQRRGAQMVMLMAPFFGATMRSTEDAVLEYFKRVAGDLDIDVMIQDAPLSPTPLSAALLARIAREVTQVRYVKIETPGTAEKLRAVIRAAGDALPGPFDGEEGITLIPDLEAGARGTMSSCLVPDRLGRIVHDFLGGRRDEAVRQWEELLPLIHFENRQCGLAATKVLMKEGGIIDSDRTRAPFPAMSAETRSQLLGLARRFRPLVLEWA